MSNLSVVTPGNLGVDFDVAGAQVPNKISIVAASTTVLGKVKLASANDIASGTVGAAVDASQLKSAIGGVTGGMIYQGTWNANTNTPNLASGQGTKGFFYKVSVAGSTNLDGNAVWNVGDMASFDGTTWDLIGGPAEAVTTVAGRIGAITLSATDVSGVATPASVIAQASVQLTDAFGNAIGHALP